MARIIWEINGERCGLRLTKELTTIGREKSCDIKLSHDREVSRFHCTIERRASNLYAISDEDSSNGTFVNNKRIGDGFTTLRHDDLIRVGKTTLLFQHEKPDAPKEILDEITREMEQGKGFSTIFHEIVESGRK